MTASFVGSATPDAQLGQRDSILIRPLRSIGPFVADCTISEEHEDELEITDQPVDQGAAISDHAFKKPARLTLEVAWSDSPQTSQTQTTTITNPDGSTSVVQSTITGNGVDQVKDIYQKLLALQESRIRFDVFTGKRVYKDMLAESIRVHTDGESENILRASVRLRQVLIASVFVRIISAPLVNQKQPQTSAPTIDKGGKQLSGSPNYNPLAGIRGGVTASVSDIAASVTN